eukprot:1717935-Pyramimonas_sp.AAC.1
MPETVARRGARRRRARAPKWRELPATWAGVESDQPIRREKGSACGAIIDRFFCSPVGWQPCRLAVGV